ncbi:MAG: DUF3768 domain-containing protein [bacterium]
MNNSKTVELSKVAQLNDSFRKSGFGVTVTPGIQDLPDMLRLLEEVRLFSDFSEDNDPYGEHDFGTIRWGCEKVFWNRVSGRWFCRAL